MDRALCFITPSCCEQQILNSLNYPNLVRVYGLAVAVQGFMRVSVGSQKKSVGAQGT